MRTKDTFDVMTSTVAIVSDAVAIFLGFLLAVWVRFDTGWIPLYHDALPPRSLYLYGAGIGTLLFLFIFRTLGLYVRPQLGSYGDKIPRITRACGWGILLAVALAFTIRTEPPFSRIVAGISFFTVTALVLVERFFLFQAELIAARKRETVNRVLVVGTDAVAARLKLALKHEPRLRSRVVGFLRTRDGAPDPSIAPELIKGALAEFEELVKSGEIDEVILADTSLPHQNMADLILTCERSLVPFLLVPDLFAVLTSRVHVEHVGDIPLLGVSKWPLDFFWNRVAKRIEDIVGSLFGLALSLPIVGVAALFIKRESPGPLFYRQERCGEGGQGFTIVKLRTMRPEAEASTGPVWATEADPRRTRVGAFLRQHNIDELPQFWNVLKGEMSLCGPRPIVQDEVRKYGKFIEDYYLVKPGITGLWQVSGRNDVSYDDRVRMDSWYVRNWSVWLDLVILLKTVRYVLSGRGAY